MRNILAILIACGLALAACGGDSPTASTPQTLNLAGNWTGTWTFVSAGATVSDAVTMTVNQNPSGTSASGQWSAAGGPAGQVTFTPGATISGTASISQTLLNGVNCSTSTTFNGTASASQIQFTLGALTPTGLCQWATNHQFTFNR